MKGAVTLTAWQRPDHTRRVLRALEQCRGVEDWYLFASVDAPAHPEVVAALEAVDFMASRVHVADRKLGCNNNTWYPMDQAFAAGFDFVVHMEDDHLLAPDAFEFFDWGRQFLDDEMLFNLSAFDKETRDPGDGQVVRRDWFTSTGAWAIDEKRWHDDFRHFPRFDPLWDCWLCLERRGQRYEYAPALSRCQNIGEGEGSLHPRTHVQHLRTHHAPHFAGDTVVSEQPTTFHMGREVADHV